MWEKNISKNPEMLQFVPNYYKTQKMCKGSVDYYHHILEYIPDCYITQEISK